MDSLALLDEFLGVEQKRVPDGKFVLIRRTWRGPIQTRWGPSDVAWDLHVGGVGMVGLERDPASEGPVLARRTRGLQYGGKSADELTGKVDLEPGTDANPSKDTAAQAEVIDSGSVTVVQDSPELVKLKLGGEKLKGLFVLKAEAGVGGLWQWEKSQPAPTAKEKVLYPLFALLLALRRRSAVPVWKDRKGQRWYAAVVSTAVKDLEGQTVTREGMDFSIALAKKYGYRSKLYIAHAVPQTLIGHSRFEMRLGPFWLELGTFLPPGESPLADAMYKALQRDGGSKCRISIGFLCPIGQMRRGIYTRVLKFDSSITDEPAMPLTAIAPITKEGGKVMDLEKILRLLNPEDEDEAVSLRKMLQELLGSEAKSLTAVQKAEGAKAIAAALTALKGVVDDLPAGTQKLVQDAIAALESAGEKYPYPEAKQAPADEGEEEEEEKKVEKCEPGEEETKKVAKTESPAAPEPKEEAASEEAKVSKTLDKVSASLEALQVGVLGMEARLKAVEEQAELVEAMKSLLQRMPSSAIRPSEEAPEVSKGEKVVKELQESLGAGPVHPLAGMFGGPTKKEGGS